MRRLIIALVIGGLAASPASAQDKKLPKQLRALIAMTPEDHLKKVAIDDDAMEVVATLDTSGSFQEKHGLLRIVWSDIFLRAFIDKTTGTATYQVYFQFKGQPSAWPRLNTANYEKAGGLESASLQQIGSDVSCSGYMGCTYTEVVVFEVGEDLLRDIASRYKPNDPNAWRIRFKGQSGLDVDEGLVAGEVAGLLMAVDAYRTENGLEDVPADDSAAMPEGSPPAIELDDATEDSEPE